MTEEQRAEIKRLSHEADIPDKSGKLLTRLGAREIIEELRRKVATHKSYREVLAGFPRFCADRWMFG